MTLPAAWIRKNMLQSPTAGCNNNDRTLTEAELKVQRSLQKLSIPEWYLGNSSRPLKLLSNVTPIESRPSAWKKSSLNKTTVNPDGVLETEFGPQQIYSTYRKVQNPGSEKSPVAKKRTAPLEKAEVPEKKSSQLRQMNISQTFPRISPSRKIQNINIVFPSTNNSQSQTISSIDTDDSQLDMTKDSLERTAASEGKNVELETSKLEDTSLMSNSSEGKVTRMPNQQLTYIKPWKSPNSCVTPEKKVSNPKLKSSSKQDSPIAQFSKSTVVASTPKEKISSTSKLAVASKEIRRPPPVTQRLTKFVPIEDDQTCDACKADIARRSSLASNHRLLSGFRARSLLPIDELSTNTPKQRVLIPISADSPTVLFFRSKKKSSQLVNIVKQKEIRKNGKSLVQELIEEFNDRCQNSAEPTYVRPGPKNFVKKLVNALEKEKQVAKQESERSYKRFIKYHEENIEEEEEEEVEEEVEEEEGSSENSSEDEVKSAAASTSISYKDTDSSDSELRSPTVKQDYSYDWNMNSIEKNLNETVTVSEAKVPDEKEEESVYWIPVTKSKLPRSSSLLSMISRLSTNSPGPCVSPIKQNERRKSQTPSNVWGMTYRTSDYARTLRRIDETTILDSGYSDRSRGQSSGSSDDTSFDDNEATQTASEIGSFNSFTLGSSGRASRAEFVGRPFVI